MNSRFLLFASLGLLASPLLHSEETPPIPEIPVPVTQAPSNKGTMEQTLLTRPEGENQKLYSSRDSLINQEGAQQVSERFRAEFGQTASPRIVIHVNRALNPHAAGEGPKEQTLADQQTVREIERLFGRVFRHAGAKLADQRAAAALLENQPAGQVGNDQIATERDALKQIADIAIEVLISSRELTVNNLSGGSTYTVPDIQATAVRLSDATILGQAAASDIVGHGTAAADVARRFGNQDITEATAFALMEDMLVGAK